MNVIQTPLAAAGTHKRQSEVQLCVHEPLLAFFVPEPVYIHLICRRLQVFSWMGLETLTAFTCSAFAAASGSRDVCAATRSHSISAMSHWRPLTSQQVLGGDHKGSWGPGKALVTAWEGSLSQAATSQHFSRWQRASASAATAAAAVIAGRERRQRRHRISAQLRPGLAAEWSLTAQKLPGARS